MVLDQAYLDYFEQQSETLQQKDYSFRDATFLRIILIILKRIILIILKKQSDNLQQQHSSFTDVIFSKNNFISLGTWHTRKRTTIAVRT